MTSPSRALHAAALAALLLSACRAAPDEPMTDTVAPMLEALPRPLTAGEQEVVRATNDFSFGLFRAVNAALRDSNVFVSPLSASYALGLTMNGAAGATQDQMRGTLGFGTTSEPEIDAGYKGLTTLLVGLDQRVDVRIANSIWHDRVLRVDPAFVDRGRTFFGARVEGLDFRDPASVGTINAWVKSATAEKIPKIVDQLGDGLVMLVVNAVYFKGSWRDRFDPALTVDAPFHGAAGDTRVRMMHRQGTMAYLATADAEAVELPYGNGAYTMTVVLPRPGRNVEDMAAELERTGWSALVAGFHEAQVDLALPRFTLEWSRTLNAELKALGMRDAFLDGIADFSRLSTGGERPYIDFVLQKTFVDVNEEGTEAAAVTGVGIGVTSVPQVVTMRVDRPFLFVIRERLSGTVLFMGKVVRLP